MTAPKKISLHIDGRPCEGEQGQTILEIARANKVYIPTLCSLEGLTSWGGCRLCIVEIEGSPKLAPSCATPAVAGSRVTTQSERLHNLRRATLELLFSERNHICPMCPSNKGDCGLQQQGYAHGIDGIRYPYLYPALPMDLSARYFGLDHNRCILCTRCVRTCDEQEGVHTLDVGRRGIKNMIVVDINQTFAESSTCTSCGACVANCPTGALFDKAAAFRGQLTGCEQVATTCTECPVGCGLKAYTRENRIVNIWGDPDSPVNRGHLCVKGRYQTWAEPRERILTPLVRRNGTLEPATWKEALGAVKKAAGAARKEERALLVSARLTNETASTVCAASSKAGMIGMFLHPYEAGLCDEPEPTPDALRKLEDADAIIVLGAHPSRDHGLVAARIRTTVRKKGARLLIFQSPRSDLDLHADVCAPSAGSDDGFWGRVAAALTQARHPAIVYGPQAMTPEGTVVMDRLVNILETHDGADAPLMIGLPRGANSLALAGAGIDPVDDVAQWLTASPTPLKFLHIVASDAPDGGNQVLQDPQVAKLLEKIGCVVVQGSYRSPLAEAAQVVLPTPVWCEKSGTVTNLEGRRLPLRPVLPVRGEAREDRAILESVFA